MNRVLFGTADEQEGSMTVRVVLAVIVALTISQVSRAQGNNPYGDDMDAAMDELPNNGDNSWDTRSVAGTEDEGIAFGRDRATNEIWMDPDVLRDLLEEWGVTSDEAVYEFIKAAARHELVHRDSCVTPVNSTAALCQHISQFMKDHGDRCDEAEALESEITTLQELLATCGVPGCPSCEEVEAAIDSIRRQIDGLCAVMAFFEEQLGGTMEDGTSLADFARNTCTDPNQVHPQMYTCAVDFGDPGATGPLVTPCESCQ